MSHAEELFWMGQEDKHAYFERVRKEPLPKVCGFFRAASDIDVPSRHTTANRKGEPLIGEQPGYTPETVVEVRAFNLSEALGHTSDILCTARKESYAAYR